ncbi:pyridoxamine 5'-phosphate oxidase family protein [Actinomycetospora chibensis]|uniref:Pyridoxamine 5'-phosphate oxidase family protein n=1 Tax=Actinomycetospora chibensis TaxID=663606 RepID=A0ABV9RG39_9PSEU|nr:pyridoxamine 5'-phosphate oxidase family protein [Actinomycetospora chibensis]MDD7922158.1 pyridoxamine 5'-phosphate oxidase family protein [Actinomycetospora chibensis]
MPISYAYGDGCVYGHCAGGKKLDLMRARPEVCVEVEDVRGLTDWRSVIAQGRFEELSGDQADEAMQLLMRRFRRERPSRTALPDDGHGTTDHGHGAGTGAPVLYRIRLHSRTGRGETPR